MEESVETQEKSGIPLKLIGVVVIVIVLGAGGYFLQGNKPAEQPKQEVVTPEQVPTATESAMKEEVKTFAVEAVNFSFNPAEIKVKKGDTVKVTLSNTSTMPHDFVIDELSVKTKQIKKGEIDEVTFVASTSGTFEYYCSVGKHRQQGMVGKLIVE